MIKAVLFDFGGVLTESGKRGFIRQTIAELYDIPSVDADIRELHLDLRRGEIGEQAFFEELNRRYGKHVTKEMFVERTQRIESSKPVIELAERLRKQGIRTGILSNVFAMNATELRAKGFYNGFDPVILSCDEGYAKPEIEIYHRAIERLGLRAEEILFIDDQEKCIPPAEELGMQTILAVSPAQIVADTEALIEAHNQSRHIHQKEET